MKNNIETAIKYIERKDQREGSVWSEHKDSLALSFNGYVEELVQNGGLPDVSGLFNADLINKVRKTATDAEARRLIMNALYKR